MKASRFRKILKFHSPKLQRTDMAWPTRKEKIEETAKRLRRERLRNLLLNRRLSDGT